MKPFETLVKENNLSSLNESGGCIEIFWTVMHQAELIMTKLRFSNDQSIAIGNGADFMMLVGSKSTQITGFTHSLKEVKSST